MKFSPWEVYSFFCHQFGLGGNIHSVPNWENNNHLHHNFTLAEGGD